MKQAYMKQTNYILSILYKLFDVKFPEEYLKKTETFWSLDKLYEKVIFKTCEFHIHRTVHRDIFL